MHHRLRTGMYDVAAIGKLQFVPSEDANGFSEESCDLSCTERVVSASPSWNGETVMSEWECTPEIWPRSTTYQTTTPTSRAGRRMAHRSCTSTGTAHALRVSYVTRIALYVPRLSILGVRTTPCARTGG